MSVGVAVIYREALLVSCCRLVRTMFQAGRQYTYSVILVRAFYKNVPRRRVEARELVEDERKENLVLEFKPNPPQDMLIACLWSKWTGKGEPDLLSFAAVTDDPPAEIALAGHDRCIVPIKPENIEAWLNPDPAKLAAQYAILDDRHQPYYEYRLAARTLVAVTH